MRRISSVCLFLSLAALIPLLGPSNGFTQGRGDKGSRGAFDPSQFFDRLSEGKDYIDLTNPSPSMARMGRFLDRWVDAAKQAGLNPSRIDRQGFSTMMDAMRSQMGGPGGRGTPRGGDSAGGNRDVFDEERAKDSFRRQDKNGDGVISPGEASDTLKAEFEKWDTNKNGVIDFDEYKEYFKARMKFLRGDNGDDRSRDADAYQRAVQEAQDQEMARPTVYHAGNLPKELPAWFSQLDRDKDGQVGLYEWKQAGYSIDDFLKWDANGDGFITVEEALRYIRANNVKLDQQGGNTPTDGSQGNTTSPTPGPGGNFPDMGGNRMGRGQGGNGPPNMGGNRMGRGQGGNRMPRTRGGN